MDMVDERSGMEWNALLNDNNLLSSEAGSWVLSLLHILPKVFSRIRTMESSIKNRTKRKELIRLKAIRYAHHCYYYY